MYKTISVEEALRLENPTYIDLRSPGEYAIGNIPGAISVPLLSDEERARVGILYKNVGPEEAKDAGLAIVSTKLYDMISIIRRFYKTGRPVVLYCWRGGMRSKSVVTILELMGIHAYQLIGGYKAYRHYVLDTLASFQLQPQVVVLCGSTGTGKTLLLQKLMTLGLPVIDLERIANHRGSVFGQIGLGKPSTAQIFDAALLQELERLNSEKLIVVECESKRIGNVYLPDSLYHAMQNGRKILVTASLDIRVQRLMDEYLNAGAQHNGAITNSIISLKTRLGVKKTEQLLLDFNAGRIHDVVRELLVTYYDPLYGYENSDPAAYDYHVHADDLKQATRELHDYIDRLRG